MTGRDRFDLHGRDAVVTGAAGLLGSVFAAELAHRGARVYLVDLDQTGADRVSSSIAERAPVAPVPIALDITDEGAVEAAIGGLDRVDVLVNSAAIDPKFEPGIRSQGQLTNYPLELWEASLRVNLTGTFLMTRACCRHMERQGERGQGAIVNVSSQYGLVGPDQRLYHRGSTVDFVKPADYSVTKAGLLGFTRAVASMYRGTEIRVNALSPGGVYNGQEEEFVERYSARTVLGRMAEPDDLRGAIAFLSSDASRYMTGANLVVDGGWTAT